ncbi:mariner transposase [Elysia marginata]|uniref:Mariner transposase n=1 Tax=Elysia marginata TaxID=1093978 RepID=A0AAV4EWT2_9GAST|nr:mariner transposase [Elysia marginata]
MATVFWDTQGVILVDFLSRGETVNSDSYIDTLKRLRARILRERPDMDIGNVLIMSYCTTMLDPTQASEQERQLARLGGLFFHIHRARLILLPLTITFSAT